MLASRYMPKYRSGAYAILLTMYKEKRPLRKFEIGELQTSD